MELCLKVIIFENIYLLKHSKNEVEYSQINSTIFLFSCLIGLEEVAGSDRAVHVRVSSGFPGERSVVEWLARQKG